MSYFPPNRASVSTTDGAVTTIATIPVPTSVTYVISALVIARRTGGSAGAANDGAAYKLIGSFYNAGGTAAIVIQGSEFSAESQSTWGATFDVTGASVRIRVNGAANNNVNWTVFWDTASVS